LFDAELLTLAVAQVLLEVRSEARWLRLVPAALPGAFPYLPGQSGYNKRLRAALPLLKRVIRVLAADDDMWANPEWLVDSTPVECARSRPAVRRGPVRPARRWLPSRRGRRSCRPASATAAGTTLRSQIVSDRGDRLLRCRASSHRPAAELQRLGCRHPDCSRR
jgi:hypothetical protein